MEGGDQKLYRKMILMNESAFLASFSLLIHEIIGVWLIGEETGRNERATHLILSMEYR